MIPSQYGTNTVVQLAIMGLTDEMLLIRPFGLLVVWKIKEYFCYQGAAIRTARASAICVGNKLELNSKLKANRTRRETHILDPTRPDGAGAKLGRRARKALCFSEALHIVRQPAISAAGGRTKKHRDSSVTEVKIRTGSASLGTGWMRIIKGRVA